MKFPLVALLAVAFFFPALAQARPYVRIACLGRDHAQTSYLEANLAGTTRLDHVRMRIYDGRASAISRDRILGTRDASEISPLDGTRFYLHSGNTASFLLLRDGELGAVRALLSATDFALRSAPYDTRYSFRLLYVFEGYEQGGFLQVSELRCGPKAIGE